ncbi:FAD/NAD(P)-binding domain-containing protein [Aspergillus steynii IBT 23096]|uniref:FAD/NAD(P)-binding domain-containing protein n=1 Tax=Aspergillus steynii IBT 23096 TaxID=1392250 RepID=A0A2I2GEN1_9EURO|nr:FAD/NAD(P)-binding domain-containing protein [Aspergillus steynii IBT 23096]PLB51297.1 FAD/NAD(P)-binding domain-containing protein [Aspergillus steynii IBT 23096]
MADSRTSRNVGNRDFTQATVVIIGAGISGLCMAIDLLRKTSCRNFVILEKGSQVGGTWFDNKYPGCACDVWSTLYSFSFAQKSDWSRAYPGQEEILQYIISVAERFGLFKYIRFNSAVQEARWDDEKQHWTVDVEVGGAKDRQYIESYQITTNFLVSAVGQLNAPYWPSLTGLDEFTGKLMHSARWDWSYDFTGKRVAVIGNGATAVQIVANIAPSVSQLTVYQRTPNWVNPRNDAPLSSLHQFLLSRIPPLRWLKRSLQMQIRELTHLALAHPTSVFSDYVRNKSIASMKAQLPDKPEYWDKLVPKYAPGCKRILVIDDYYSTLNRKNVALDTRPIRGLTEQGVQTDDGAEAEFDLIVLATGFRAVEFMHPIRVFGKNGRPLSEIWKDGAAAYKGATVEDMPNFGMLFGPNTSLGHNSIILMIEAQSRYLSTLIQGVVKAKKSGKSLAITPRPEVVQRYNEEIHARLEKTSLADPNCHSWYKTESGKITTTWPGTAVQYQREMSRVCWEDYVVEGTGKQLVKGKKVYLGRVVEEIPVSYPALILGMVGFVAGGVGWMNGLTGERVGQWVWQVGLRLKERYLLL